MPLLLEGKVDDRDFLISGLRAQVGELQQALQDERAKSKQIDHGAKQLRTVLNPLYYALKHVYGEIDTMGIGASEHSESPKASAVWESWKQKLGGQTAEAIDVLALHGEMNAEQLRIHLRCARTHIYNIIAKLNKAGIINKNGGKISLKTL